MLTFARGACWLVVFSLLPAVCPLRSAEPSGIEEVTQGLKVVRGPVNGALLERGGKVLAVYGDPREHPAAVDTVLFTHHRRDVVWAGRALLASGAKAIVPQAEVDEFTEVHKFWSEFERKRFHDYAQRTTKILGEPIPVAKTVQGSETLTWEGVPIRVLDTPGYTRGAVTYLVELDGRRIAFTGDLVYGDGKIPDLYSLQDAIPEAKIGGYHGYAARLGDLIASLRQVAAEKPDVLVPARGPLIRNPSETIQTLIARIQALYANYLSIDALRWYLHDDHTDQVSQLVELFGCTVHASRANWDVLENPGAYRLPCLTANPIHVSGRAASGARWRWKEFEMTLCYFPGQTLHHDALLVKKDGGEQVFFIGDSFTPSGIDDYCLPNRNFLHDGTGYFFCLDLLKRAAPEALLINEHVAPAFRFSSGQIDQMTDVLKKRVDLLRSLVPWDDPNFGLDESWARFYPYASRLRRKETAKLCLRIMNHSPVEQVYDVRIHLPEGWTLRLLTPAPIRIPAREEGSVAMTITAPELEAGGTHIVTADLRWGAWDLREWTETMVTLTDAE